MLDQRRCGFRRVLSFALLGLLFVSFGAARVEAQQLREPVEFQVAFPAVGFEFPGLPSFRSEGIYVLGSLEELGGGDISKAVALHLTDKTDDNGVPLWQATVSLPLNTSYTYAYYLKDNVNNQAGNFQAVVSTAFDYLCAAKGQAIAISEEFTGSTSSTLPITKKIIYLSERSDAVLNWREDPDASFTSTPMNNAGQGRTEDEVRWEVEFNGLPGRTLEFFFSASRGRDSNKYSTPLNTALIQDGQVFNYQPAADVSPLRRDYNPLDPPSVFILELGQSLFYGVVLPRGYDDHPERSYPVIYVHDGQRAHDVAPAIDLDGRITEDLVQAGQIREAIFVTIHTPVQRSLNLLPPCVCFDGIEGNSEYFTAIVNTLMPIIDSQYRTLEGSRKDTGTLGFSFGGVAATHLGIAFPDQFGLVGSLSGSFWVESCPRAECNLTSVTPWYFIDQALADQFPADSDFRFYYDAGNDNSVQNNILNQVLLRRMEPDGTNTFVQHGNMLWKLHCHENHLVAHVKGKGRFDVMLKYLLPVELEVNELE